MDHQQPRRGARAHVKDPVRYKTVLCNKFEAFGKCPYGPRCQFAHGEDELRERKPLKPTNGGPGSPAATASVEHEELGGMSITPPPTPRQIWASPPPLTLDGRPQRHKKVTPITEASNSINENETTCEACEAGDVPALSLLQLDHLSGQVVCRRDASHNTLSVRRTISFLWDDHAESGAPLEAAPRISPWAGLELPPIDTTPPPAVSLLM